MTDTGQKIVRATVQSRLEIALNRLREKPEYSELLQKQDESSEAVDKLLNKLSKDERSAIYRHFEGEAARESEELYEAYIQGIGDCIKFFTSFGVPDPDMPMKDIAEWLNEEGKTKKSILERLYNGDIYPAEEIVCQDPEYRVISGKIVEERKYFESRLSPEDAKRFEAYDSLMANSSCLYACTNFSYGFKLGGLLMREVIEDSNSP